MDKLRCEARLRVGCLLAAGLALSLAGCATRPAGTAPASAAPSNAAPANTPPPSLDRTALMVASATAMLGQPYRFGGAAPGGFDCSGLVVYAAGSAGIRLPRTAEEQMRTGVRVPRHELRAGDLVFMHLAHKELHVGIAVDREHFIHAPSTGGHVRTDALAAPPYARGYLGARRVIESGGGPARP